MKVQFLGAVFGGRELELELRFCYYYSDITRVLSCIQRLTRAPAHSSLSMYSVRAVSWSSHRMT